MSNKTCVDSNILHTHTHKYFYKQKGGRYLINLLALLKLGGAILYKYRTSSEVICYE
jgi:hypothetical protein